jgi:SPP1 gp7 family putative phage head morphogenesis protein
VSYESRINRSISQIRKDQAARERETVRQLAQAYQRTADRIIPELDRLRDELAALLDAGKPVTIGRLYRMDRYRSLLIQANDLFTGYADEIGEAIDIARQLEVARAQTEANDLVRAALGPAPDGVDVDGLFTRLPESAVTNIVGTTREGPLAELLDQFGATAAQDIREALITGVALGEHPNRIARRMKAAMDGNLVRARMIARTETLRAYRESTRRYYEENSKVVKSWIWHSALGVRTCAACWAMHGREFPFSEPMGTHPNCRCAMVPKTKTWKELGFSVPDHLESSASVRRGPDIFRELDADTQRAILGPKAFSAYTRGEVDLEDFVQSRVSSDWGITRSRGSLEHALNRAAKRGVVPPAPTPIRPVSEIKPGSFADLDEAHRWARENYPDIEWDFEGMHVDVINPSMARFDQLAQQYPEVTKRLKYVGGYQGPNRIQSYNWNPNTYAHASRDGKRIGLNPAYYGDPMKFQRSIARDAESGWHPAGIVDVDSIFTHEFGHQVHNWLLSVPSDIAHFPVVASDGGGLVQVDFYRFFVNNRATKRLSAYATTSSEESFAEGFTLMVHDPKRVNSLAYTKRQRRVLAELGDPSKWLGKDQWRYARDLPIDDRDRAMDRIRKFEQEVGI